MSHATIEAMRDVPVAPMDRGEAVNLARELIQHDSDDITQSGVRLLCESVLLMDAALLQSTALPVDVQKRETRHVVSQIQPETIDKAAMPVGELTTK